MKKLALLPALGILLAACGSEGLAPSPVAVEFQVSSAVAAGDAENSGTARGETNQVVITGTLLADCSTGLSAAARQYGNDKLVLDLLSQPGARTCDVPNQQWAYAYESVLKGVRPGIYQVEILHNSLGFPAPTQTVTVR